MGISEIIMEVLHQGHIVVSVLSSADALVSAIVSSCQLCGEGSVSL